MKRWNPIAYCFVFALSMGQMALAQTAPKNAPAIAAEEQVSNDVELLPLAVPENPVLTAAAINVPSLPDAPSALTPQVPAQEQAIPAKRPAVDLNAPPAMNSPLGGPFWISNTLLMASTVANIEMIMGCRASSCQMVPDSIRNRGALYGIGIPASLGVSYISYKLKRAGTRWWILPVAVFTAGNVFYAAHAAQWGR
jgi:hypothetical protein